MNRHADVPRVLGLERAGHIILAQDENGVLLTMADHALRRIRALAAPFKPNGRSMVDELLADRKEDVVRDDGQGTGASRG